MSDAVCEVTWGLRDGTLIAECGTCGATHTVTHSGGAGRVGRRPLARNSSDG